MYCPSRDPFVILFFSKGGRTSLTRLHDIETNVREGVILQS